MNTQSPLTGDRPLPAWGAWGASLFLHGLLLIVALLLATSPKLRGAGEPEPRNVGIVLKTSVEDRTVFTDDDSEGDDSKGADSEGLVEATAEPQAADVIANANVTPQTEAALALPGFGQQSTEQEQLGDALAMAQATGGGRARLGGAGKTRVRLFGVEGEGTRFVYVLDRSDSMTGPPLQAMKRQLTASLNSLDSIHQFHLLFFNHRLQIWQGPNGQGRVSFASEANRRSATDFIAGMTAEGGTYRWDALQRAIALRPDVVFFLTDIDNPMPAADVAKAIARAKRDGTAIQTIEFGVGGKSSRDNFLKRLARETGGGYDYVDVRSLE